MMISIAPPYLSSVILNDFDEGNSGLILLIHGLVEEDYASDVRVSLFAYKYNEDGDMEKEEKGGGRKKREERGRKEGKRKKGMR